MRIELPKKVSQVIDVLEKNGYEAFAVGGCVRDSLLQRVPQDWDITTSASPFDVKRLFRHTVDTGIAHGTVTVLLSGDSFEVTTYRIDGAYEDGRHPNSVSFSTHLNEDLLRRDFTINAMAYNEREGLVDLYGGVTDLENRVIRCVGTAKERFLEDALRILRAFRFSAELDFSIEETTLFAAGELSERLTMISAERIFTELRKLLLSGHPQKLLLMQQMGITKWFLPEFDRMLQTEQNHPAHCNNVGVHTMQTIAELKPESFFTGKEFSGKEFLILRFAALLHDVAKPSCKTTNPDGTDHFYKHAQEGATKATEILRRLKTDNELVSSVKVLVQYHNTKLTEKEDEVRRLVHAVGKNLCPLLFELKRADLCAHAEPYKSDGIRLLTGMYRIYTRVTDRGDCTEIKNLAVNGQDLLMAKVPSGPCVGGVLNRMLMLVLKDPEKNQKDILLSMLPALLKEENDVKLKVK